MTITPEVLSTLGITKEDVVAAISKGAIVISEEDYSIHELIEGAINKHLEVSTKSAVEKAVHDKMSADIPTMLETMKFQPTDSWGSPKGEAKTFKEFVANAVDQVFMKKVDQWGKWDSGSIKNQTYIEFLLFENLKGHVQHHVKQALGSSGEAVGKAIADAVRAQAYVVQKAVEEAVAKTK